MIRLSEEDRQTAEARQQRGRELEAQLMSLDPDGEVPRELALEMLGMVLDTLEAQGRMMTAYRQRLESITPK